MNNYIFFSLEEIALSAWVQLKTKGKKMVPPRVRDSIGDLWKQSKGDESTTKMFSFGQHLDPFCDHVLS